MREMKDSGIEWIGEIPEHWRVENPKWHFVQRKDRATKRIDTIDSFSKIWCCYARIIYGNNWCKSSYR